MNKITFEGYFKTGCFDILAEYFPLFSVRDKSIPGAGSPCFATERLIGQPTLLKLIEHRNGNFTAITPNGYLKFWRK